MAELDQQSSLQYWKNYPDGMIFRVIGLMESVENWTLDDHPEVESILTELGEALETITQFELKNQEDYIRLGNHLHMSRILRLMQAIDTTHPGSASRLLMHAEQNTLSDSDPEGLFLRRNIVFERLRLLGRVFSIERLDLIKTAMQAQEEDDDD
jgi:intracellular multiplication protein IcmW